LVILTARNSDVGVTALVLVVGESAVKTPFLHRGDRWLAYLNFLMY